jgi:hypothetical protein
MVWVASRYMMGYALYPSSNPKTNEEPQGSQLHCQPLYLQAYTISFLKPGTWHCAPANPIPSFSPTLWSGRTWGHQFLTMPLCHMSSYAIIFITLLPGQLSVSFCRCGDTGSRNLICLRSSPCNQSQWEKQEELTLRCDSDLENHTVSFKTHVLHPGGSNQGDICRREKWKLQPKETTFLH